MADAIGMQQLHRGGPAQHHVVREIDDAHAAFADLALERVLAELLRRGDLLAQAVDDLGARGGEQDRDDRDLDEADR